MLTPFTRIGLALLVLGSMQLAQAQKQTEIYIPIGKSPGVSRTQTLIGTVETVNLPDQSLMMRAEQRRYRVQITNRTQIWLDRSAIKLPNQPTSLASCQPERQVEVKYEGSEPGEQVTAEWIKVQVRDGQP